MSVGFEQFVASSTPRLVRAARMLLGEAGDAEDMAQETLIVMHRHWARLRETDAAEAYAYRTLVRLTRRHARTGRLRRAALDGDVARQVAATPPVERDDQLAAALAALPTRQREAVVLRYYLDLSISETAHLMRCTQGTVKSQVSKALAALRERLPSTDGSTRAGHQ
jgi:RNA polymerase sigma-70 factor (sigma-E family)